MDVAERARRYVARMDAAVSGSGGHVATFKVAVALRHGFGMAFNEAWPLMLEYNERCAPRWNFRELEHKLNEAAKVVHQEPRGHLLGEIRTADGQRWSNEPGTAPPAAVRGKADRNWRAFEPAALDEEQRTDVTVDAVWLWRRSPLDVRSMPAADFLTHVSAPGDRLLVFNNERTQGQYIFWNHEEERRRGWYRLSDYRGEKAVYVGTETPADILRARMGVWWLNQPVTGEWKSNGQKWSRRSEINVTSWRTMVIESDEPGIESAWLNLLVQLPLRIMALYTSGGRSVHALVRVDMPSKAAWDQLKDVLKPVLTRLGADKGVFSAVRLTRLPGCKRLGKVEHTRYVPYEEPRLQQLLYLHPETDGRPIIEQPVLRREPMWEEAYV